MTTPYGGEHQRLRLLVLARDGYICHWCGNTATEADHLVELVHGGTNDLDNYVASCGPCNRSRGGRVGNRRRVAKKLSNSRRW